MSAEEHAFSDVRLRVSAELGRTWMPVAEAVAQPPGAVIDLDRSPEDPVDLMVSGRRLGRGRLVVVDGEWALEIEEIEGVRQPSKTPES